MIITKGENMEIINKYYDIIGSELKEMIKNVENKPETTKNRYGNYMELISFLIDAKVNKNIVKELLIKCGGNVNGINDAMKIFNI